MTKGEGERLFNRQRRRFWILIAVIVATGMIIGAARSILFLPGGEPSPDLLTLSVPARASLVAAAVLLFSGVTWWYFREVDELEFNDNLWASTFALYVYVTVFPAWYALFKMRVTGEPQDWQILGVTLFANAVAYVWRKLAMR